MNPDRDNPIDGLALTLMTVGLCIIPFIMMMLDTIHANNIKKLKRTNRTKIISTYVEGDVESIHIGGRTEIVPMKEVQLEYFEYCDEWVLYGDVVQPIGRNGYFMPVLKGKLDLDVNENTQTWIEYGSYGFNEDEETYKDFRMASIKVKTGGVTNIEYSHYRLLPNHTWNIVSTWNAKF